MGIFVTNIALAFVTTGFFAFVHNRRSGRVQVAFLLMLALITFELLGPMLILLTVTLAVISVFVPMQWTVRRRLSLNFGVMSLVLGLLTLPGAPSIAGRPDLPQMPRSVSRSDLTSVSTLIIEDPESPFARAYNAGSNETLNADLHGLRSKVDQPWHPYKTELSLLHGEKAVGFKGAIGFGVARMPAQSAWGEADHNDVPHKVGSHFDASNGTDSDQRWVIERLELVSLLKFKEARAYVSEELPALNNLKEATTRSLDDFETKALAELWHQGEVIVMDEPRRVRMLGALRADERCSNCHRVKDGQLLGALSYVLRRKKKS